MPDPTPDTLTYTSAGKPLAFVPIDQRGPLPAGRPVAKIYLDRTGDAKTLADCGVWVPEGSAEILRAPPAVTPPDGPTDGTIVEPGQSWAAALKACPAGKAVYLRAGAEYAGGMVDASVRLSGVRLAAWPANGQRATIRVPSGTALALWAAADFSATDLRFVADKPTDPGVRFSAGCRNVRLTRCEVTGFTFGVTVEGSPAARNSGVTLAGCYVHDNYNAANQDSSGLFVSLTDGLTLTGNQFVRNGWRDNDPVAKGAIRNHNVYVAGDNGPIVATGNLFALASSHGLQARSGGTITGNTFVDNPIHLSVGLVNGNGPVVKGGVTATVVGNTFSGTRPCAGSPRGWGIETGNAKDVTISGNTFSRDGDYDPKLGTFPAAIKVDVCDLTDDNPMKGQEVKVVKLLVSANAVRWPFAPLWRNPNVPAAGVLVQSAWGAVDQAAVAKTTSLAMAAAK